MGVLVGWGVVPGTRVVNVLGPRTEAGVTGECVELGIPVRSAIHKPQIGRLVLLYVSFLLFIFGSLIRPL